MSLTDKERQDIATALQRAGSTHPCPSCRHHEFHIGDGYAQIPVSSSPLGGDQDQIETMPYALTFCQRCGFASLHSLEVLGLLPRAN